MIVEVRFIKDSQSVQTGNEFYPVGASAHFYESQADALIAEGRVELCNTNTAVVETESPPAPDFDGMTVKELRVYAYANGVKSPTKLRKVDLIAALERKNDG